MNTRRSSEDIGDLVIKIHCFLKGSLFIFECGTTRNVQKLTRKYPLAEWSRIRYDCSEERKVNDIPQKVFMRKI